MLLAMTMAMQKPCIAQADDDFDLERFVEDLFSLQEADINYADFYESLLLLYQNPLNINAASSIELKNTYVLSDQQINNLQTYIEERGKLVTLYELQVIDGFNFETIQKLLPFIMVDSREATTDTRPLIQRVLSERNNYFISRFESILEQKRGFSAPREPDDTRYAGSPSKLYFRYRVSKSNDFSFGFTAEKDPGEALVWDGKSKRYGMDFWSAHALVENQGKFRKLMLGDYQMQFGQGLLFGAGFSVGKGSETVNTTQRISLGIRPYTSVLESGFLRGIAATYGLSPKIDLTAFLSGLKQDATIRESEGDEGPETFFSTVRTSGFHRTAAELSNRRNITERVYGLNITANPHRQISFGTTVVWSQFDVPVQPSQQLYRNFEFRGKSNLNASIYLSYYWQGFSLFTEGAISKSGGFGGVAGFTKNLTSRLALSMVLRNYGINFHTFRGTAFGENSRNINEKGVYWGIKYVLSDKLWLSAYYDTFSFPFLKFRVNAPSTGYDYLIRINYNPRRQARIYAQLRSETKETNAINPDTGKTIVLPGTKNQYIINVEFNAGFDVRLKSRVQWSNYMLNNETTQGAAFIQDASYKFKSWSFSGRMAFFDTKGSQNRQYAYERDVLYAFSIPAYSGRGVRNYLLIQYKAARKLELWARIARTTFYDRQEIGTGLERIEGDKRTEVKFQVRYKLK